MEEGAMQPRSLKLTIKLKNEKTVGNSLTAVDQLKNAEGKLRTSSSSVLPSSNVAAHPQDQPNLDAVGGSVNHYAEGEENPLENSQMQMVLYDPTLHGASEAETMLDPSSCKTPSFIRRRSFSDQAPRALPSIGAFTVQCANCFKWRLIPTKEKYEEIREHIMEQPFFCKTVQEWRPEISCDNPPDITQDGSRLWAIDKPSIAQPPPGWQRLLRIRGEGSTKFADVYYVSPTGKKLRSMVEVQRFLDENPQYVEGGVTLAKFSFQIPRPLQENYVRKRPARAEPTNDAGNPVTPVLPIAWVCPTDGELQPGGPTESPKLTPETQPTKKKKKTSAKRRSNNDIVYSQNQNEVNGTESVRI